MDTIEPRLLRYPAVHDDTVVFCYAGDLWVANTQSGAVARRLTSFPGAEVRPRISPDGKWVAFTGSYDGGNNVYVIPIEGGVPKRLTYSTDGDLCLNWTPDGKIMYASLDGNVVPDQAALYIIDPNGGAPVSTPIKEVASASMFPDGHRIAYTRAASFNFNWRRYRGGTQGRVSIYDMANNSYSELPSGREQSYHPMVIGDDIYYISDRAGGTLNLYRNHAGRDEKLTNFTNSDIRYPSTDGKSVVFENDGFLYQYTVQGGTLKKLSPQVLAENLTARPRLRNLAGFISGATLSPSGARIVVDARGELFSVPAKKGETRNMTRTSGAREMSPSWSPDGKTIAYLSDQSGEYAIYTQPQLGGTPTQLTTGTDIRPVSMQWSPDAKYLVVTTLDNGLYLLEVATKKLTKIDQSPYGFAGLDVSANGKWVAYVTANHQSGAQVFIYDIAAGKSMPVTRGYYADSDVAFDQNNSYLYIISSRTFRPTPGQFEASLKVEDTSRVYAIPLSPDVDNPFLESNDEEGAPAKKGEKPTEVKLDLAGADDRTMVLPFEASSYQNLVGAQGGFFVWDKGTLWKYDLGAPKPTPIYQGLPAPSYQFNPSRTKFMVALGGRIQVLDAQPGQTLAAPAVDLSGVEATIDPKQEWKQIYWDAWRYIRDNYYDKDMRGMDWKAIGDRYASYLPFVEHRDDLNYIIGLLLGELGTGHSYITARGDTGVNVPLIPVGYLGADYVADGDMLKFKKILRGRNDKPEYQAPLGKPGISVKEGDYLLSIDGQKVGRMVNPATLLVGKAGKLVTIQVSSSMTGENPRTYRIRPVPTEDGLRYADFLDRMQRMVYDLSGGKVGYMHIRDTAMQGSEDFVNGFYQQFDKPALLIDERWNHGGYPQPWFVNTMARTVQAGMQPRHGEDVIDAPVHEGPKAMLINQYAGSGGDFFPYMFRLNKLGPLVGKRTWGGLVGINGGFRFVDGGNITAPSFSLYDRAKNEIIAENIGTEPDIDVDLRPDLLAAGKDPQVEAAVKYLMAELAKRPVPAKRTKVPVVGENGRIKP